MDEERDAFKRAASQTSILDKELAALEPSPFEFRFKFEDDDGRHNFQNGDWEAHAMFWNGIHRMKENEVLDWMNETFNVEYMLFAVGNQAKRPRTWQLLGVLRVDEMTQTELPL